MPRDAASLDAPAAAPLRLSIIVPFHRNLDQLQQCLAAIARAAANLPRGARIADVIVVADGAVDDPQHVARDGGARVIAIDGPQGPAAARNRGAAAATGDVLVFVDTDVVIAPAALGQFAALFLADPTLGAAFGAYDDAPAEPGFLSQCRNLAHSFVHHRAQREAQTFWAGLGAIRAPAFAAVGGFDERFRKPSVEDIDLGYRVRAAGHRIALDPAIQGKHLKRWTFRSSIVTDVRDRGVPWTQLIARQGVMHNDLNVSHKYRACVVIAYLLVLSLVAACWQPWWLVGSGLAVISLWLLDWSYYAYFARHRGVGFALRWFPFHVLHHLSNGVSFVAGTALGVIRRTTGLAVPGSLPLAPWSGAGAPAAAPKRSLLDRYGLIAVCVLAFWVGSASITDETRGSSQGDVPRYLMNGVYMLDVLRDRPFSSLDTLIDYTVLYYSRYPALSLGHHPPLTSAAEVPLFAVLGISVRAGRLVPLLAFIFATALLYKLARNVYEPIVGLLAATFFATTPIIVQVSRAVLSEMPTLALIIASAYTLHRFCATQRRGFLILFAVLAALSLAAKQLAVFLFPAYAVMAVAALGIRRFFRRDALMALLVLAGLSAPLVPLTLKLSRANVNWTLQALVGPRQGFLELLQQATATQLNRTILLMTAAGLVLAAVRRDRRALLFVAWTLSVLGGLLLAGLYDPPRYSIYWIPSLAVLAASTAAGWPRTVQAAVVVVGLAAAVAQGRGPVAVPLTGIGGYEEAAKYVLASKPGPTVLFCGAVDAGFFTFFTRKHDPGRQLSVIRADKIFTTSFMNQTAEELIHSPAEIYPRLQRFGIRLVVIEDRPTRGEALEWLRAELKTNRFAERKRIAVDETLPARGQLVVYEYLEATPPDRETILSMNIPLISRQLSVKLGDLIDRKYLR